jgi:predicted RNase H-like nuclease
MPTCKLTKPCRGAKTFWTASGMPRRLSFSLLDRVLLACRQPPITQHVVVGTAGKLKSLMASRLLGLEGIKIMVFDEADQMLSVDGFQESSIQMIARLRQVAPEVQFLLFSATFDEQVKSYCMKVRAMSSGLELCCLCQCDDRSCML